MQQWRGLSSASVSATGGGSSNTEQEKAKALLDKWGWALRMLGYGSAESTRGTSSALLYRACQEQAGLKELAEEMQTGDSFRDRHALVMLHVWCIHRRLLGLGAEGKLMQEAMFDAVWEDSRLHIRSLGVPELTVNKHLKQLQQVSFGALISYDNGLAQDHDTFAGTLYRNIYKSDESIPEEVVYRLATYVKMQLDAIERLPEEQFMKGRIYWVGQSPEVLSHEEGAPQEIEMSSEADAENVWEATLDQQGRTYYWNIHTRESVWEVPEGGVLK